jgi:hypothetical protein
MLGPIVGLIGAGLYLLGFLTCAVLCASKPDDERITCGTCRHNERGDNPNCYKCQTKGRFTGYERGN